jgi:hypothetical protein
MYTAGTKQDFECYTIGKKQIKHDVHNFLQI